jgi:hypothetical protein
MNREAVTSSTSDGATGMEGYFGKESLAKIRRTNIGLKALKPLPLSVRESRFVGDLLRVRCAEVPVCTVSCAALWELS